MTVDQDLDRTMAELVVAGKGILAADESLPTIEKRFRPVGVASTEQTRGEYRELLFTAAGFGEFISGVILFEESLAQRGSEGIPLPELIRREGAVAGIKVDRGTVPLPGTDDEKITQGLDGLAGRLEVYKAQGARFAKWRAVYQISEAAPSPLAMEANATVLARYAAICQSIGVVPIVEPEVLMDGDHSIDRCAEVTETVQRAVFAALSRYGVELERMVLKPNMVLPGSARGSAEPVEIAAATVAVMKRTVPSAVPSVNFLSGGQSPMEATANLNAINSTGRMLPWLASFSYGRALQQPVLEAWGGSVTNRARAQQALLERARLNGLAVAGRYTGEAGPGSEG